MKPDSKFIHSLSASRRLACQAPTVLFYSTCCKSNSILFDLQTVMNVTILFYSTCSKSAVCKSNKRCRHQTDQAAGVSGVLAAIHVGGSHLQYKMGQQLENDLLLSFFRLVGADTVGAQLVIGNFCFDVNIRSFSRCSLTMC